MQKIRVWIYRPDKAFNPNVVPDLCYTPDGQNYRDWQRDEQEAYNYKVEQIKRRLKEAERPNKDFIEDYWR